MFSPGGCTALADGMETLISPSTRPNIVTNGGNFGNNEQICQIPFTMMITNACSLPCEPGDIEPGGLSANSPHLTLIESSSRFRFIVFCIMHGIFICFVACTPPFMLHK